VRSDDEDEGDMPEPPLHKAGEGGGGGGVASFDFGLLASAQQKQKYAPIDQDRLNRIEFDDDLASDLGASPAIGYGKHVGDENATGEPGGGATGTVRVRRTMAPRLPSFMQPLGMNPPTPRGSKLQLRGEPDATIVEEGSDYLGAGEGAGAGAGAGADVLGEVAGNVGVGGAGAKYHGYGDLAPAPRSKQHTYDIGANKPDWGFDNNNNSNGNSRALRTNTRVISSTGVDIGDTRMEYLDDDDAAFEGVRAGLRGRNVSGMRMEEGSAGGY